MVNTNFVAQTITQQLANRSGQVGISQSEGGWQFVDELSGKTINSQSVSNSLLANPQRVNDPKIKAQALNLARGYYANRNVPAELVEAIATVAAYVSATRGISVSSLISDTSISLELVSAYNALKPKSSQLGMLQSNLLPKWANNPTLRGSIAAAIVDSQ